MRYEVTACIFLHYQTSAKYKPDILRQMEYTIISINMFLLLVTFFYNPSANV